PDAVEVEHCGGSDCGGDAGTAADRQTVRAGEYGNAAGVRGCVCGRVDSAPAPSADAPTVQDPAGTAGTDSGYRERAVPDLDVADADEGGCGGLAGGWVHHLLHLQGEAQKGAACATRGDDC